MTTLTRGLSLDALTTAASRRGGARSPRGSLLCRDRDGRRRSEPELQALPFARKRPAPQGGAEAVCSAPALGARPRRSAARVVLRCCRSWGPAPPAAERT